MKTSLVKKVCAIIIAAALFAVAANAQIVYTDVNPDSTVRSFPRGSVNYNLDLNNDGLYDFKITSSNIPIGCRLGTILFNLYVNITRLDSNVVATDSYGNYALKMGLNQDINSNLKWSQLTLNLESKIGCSRRLDGYWTNISDGYLGLKLTIGNKTYYGWARVSVSVGSLSCSFTIKDYAYNSIPD
jgi:hypothetical protein